MRESFRTLWPYLKRYRRGLALGMGSLILKDLAHASVPLILGGAIDALTAHRPLTVILLFALSLVVVAAVRSTFQFWMRVILIGISRDIEYDLRNDLFAHLVGLSPDFYARQRTGDIMARATNDLNAVRMMLGPGIMYWFETTLTFLLAIGIMVSVDWRLAIFAVMPAPAVSFAVVFFGRRIHDRFEKLQGMFGDISSRVQENLSGVRMVRAFVQERAEMRRFEDLNVVAAPEQLGCDPAQEMGVAVVPVGHQRMAEQHDAHQRRATPGTAAANRSSPRSATASR